MLSLQKTYELLSFLIMNTKEYKCLLALLLVLFFSTHSFALTGSGAYGNPYVIKTSEDLFAYARIFRNSEKNAGVLAKLDDDIVINEDVLLPNDSLNREKMSSFKEWVPIGTSDKPYYGVFDGNGKTISGVYVNGSSVSNNGFFGVVGNAEIKNLTIKDSYIGSGDDLGLLAGFSYGGLRVSNCTFEGTVAGHSYVGGVIGHAYGSSDSLKNVTHRGLVKGYEGVGGMIGIDHGSYVSGDNYGTVKGWLDVGGVMGRTSVGELMYAYNKATVLGDTAVGGLVGRMSTSSGRVYYGVNEGSVGGNVYVGGLAGKLEAGRFMYSVNNGRVYEASASNDNKYIGGLVGWNSATVEQNINFAPVVKSLASYVGCVAGYDGSRSQTNTSKSTMNNDYYNKNVCAHSAIASHIYNDSNIVGKTFSELVDPNTLTALTPRGSTNKWTAGSFVKNNDTVTYSFPTQITKHVPTAKGVFKYTLRDDRHLSMLPFVKDDILTAKFVFDNYDGYFYGDASKIEVVSSSLKNGAKPKVSFYNMEFTLDVSAVEAPNPLVAAGEYFEISTLNDLDLFVTAVYDGQTSINAKLMNNITYNSASLFRNDGELRSDTEILRRWSPIGTSSSPYQGVFNGNGKTIKGLFYKDASKNYIGMFGATNGATIKNVTLDNSYLGGHDYVGGLVGYGVNTVIDSINNKSYVSGNAYMGGVIGYAVNSNSFVCSIDNSSNNGNVKGYKYVGGIVGKTDCPIYYSYNRGYVKGSGFVGGLVGETSNDIDIAFNDGIVYSDSIAGGICGNLDNGRIRNVYNAGTIQYLYQNGNVGGICGNFKGEIRKCISFGKFESITFDEATPGTGMIVGNKIDGTIQDAYYDVDLSPYYVAVARGGSENDGKKITTVDLASGKRPENFGVSVWIPGSWSFSDGNQKAIFTMPYLMSLAVAPLPQLTLDAVYALVPGKDGFYEIHNAEELKRFAFLAQMNSSIEARLVNDISLNENKVLDENGALTSASKTEWSLSIGTKANPYTGTFDGNNKTISGVYISSSNDSTGFFGIINNAKIKNLKLEDSYVHGRDAVGTLVGVSYESVISNCSVNASVTESRNKVGGLVGYCLGSKIENSSFLGHVSGTSSRVGGLVGVGSSCVLVSSSNQGDVSGNKYVGGVIGFSSGDTVEFCNNKGLVKKQGSGFDTKVGFAGLVGSGAGGLLLNSYNQGTVVGDKYVGGILGQTDENESKEFQVISCYNEGSVSGTNSVGGLLGWSRADKISMLNSYNLGNVSGTAYAGGLAGSITGFGDDQKSIESCYSVGKIEKAASTNGCVFGGSDAILTSSFIKDKIFYDVDHCSYGAVANTDGENGNVVGLTMLEMAQGQFPEAFAGEGWSMASTTPIAVKEGSNSFTVKLPALTAFEGKNNPKKNGSFKIELNHNEFFTEKNVTLDDVKSISLKLDDMEYSDPEQLAFAEHDLSVSNQVGGTFYGVDFTLSIDPLKILVSNNGIFEIGSADQLVTFANMVNAGKYSANAKLTRNIVMHKNLLEGVKAAKGEPLKLQQWTPIGTEEKPYLGTFDGDGHVISGLYSVDFKTNVGLFGNLGDGSTVQKVGVVDSYFKGDENVGGIAGYSTGRIIECFNAATVEGGSNIGGIAGAVGESSQKEFGIKSCYNVGSVFGAVAVGGLCGSNVGSIVNSYNTGSVTPLEKETAVGCLVGLSKGQVEANYSNVDFCGFKSIASGDGKSIMEGNSVEFVKSPIKEFVNAPWSADVGATATVVGDEVGAAVFKMPSLAVFGDNNKSEIVGGLRMQFDIESHFGENPVSNFKYDGELVVGNTRIDGTKCFEKFIKPYWEDDGTVSGIFCGVNYTYEAPSLIYASEKMPAVLYGYSKQPLSIPEGNSTKQNIFFKRQLPRGALSTIFLPFEASVENFKDLLFINFDGVEKKGGKWEVHTSDVPGGMLMPNTPYLVVSKSGSSEIAFPGTVFTTKAPKTAGSGTWDFIGTTSYHKWLAGDKELGYVYGFAGMNGNDPEVVGQFRKIGAGAYIYPMRAYLRYNKNSGGSRPAANGSAKPAASGIDEALPETLDVVYTPTASDGSMEKTTVIGTFNTRTGEFTAVPNRYFDVNGRHLGENKPKSRKIFYNAK